MVNWYWPEPGGDSVAVPSTGQLLMGSARSVEPTTVKVTPLTFVKPKRNPPFPSHIEVVSHGRETAANAATASARPAEPLYEPD